MIWLTTSRFALCMNTGILGILMHQFPYQFNGIPVLATIAYILDLVLFIIFSVIFVSRFIIYPDNAWAKIAVDSNELTYLVCWPIAWLTLVALTALVASQASWGGHAFTLVAYVMWWIGAAWTFTFGVIIYITVFEKNKIDHSNMPPSMFIPAVGVATASSVAGLVVNYSHDMSARLAIPVVIVAYILLGQGIFLGIILFAIYLHHLMVEGMPKGPKAPSIFLLVAILHLPPFPTSAYTFTAWAYWTDRNSITALRYCCKYKWGFCWCPQRYIPRSIISGRF